MPARILERWGFSALLAAIITVLPGCSPSSRPSGPRGCPDVVSLLSPAPWDTVSGEVRMSAFIRTESPAAAVVFLADGEVVGERGAPPWEAVWSSDAPAGGSWRSLAVEVRFDRAENDAPERSEPVLVRVLPDSAPRISFVVPGDPGRRSRWIRREGDLIVEARARDPEDGPLPAERIVWNGPTLFRPLAGAILPLELLPDGPQELVAEAADRWGRTGRATVLLAPFRYEAASSPEICLENFRRGILALEAAGCAEQLASTFCFVPCPEQARDAPWEEVWGRELFLARLAAWLDDPALSDPLLDWEVSGRSLWNAGGSEQAWITLTAVRLSCASSREAGSTFGEAHALLEHAPDEPWKVVEWRETPPPEGTSLASVLAEAAGLPCPSAAARCRPQAARSNEPQPIVPAPMRAARP